MSTLPSPWIEQNSCLSEDLVLAFQRGETTERERQGIHRHIDVCDVCRQLLLTTSALEGSGSALGAELDSMDRLAAVLGSGMRLTAFTEGKRLAHRFEVKRFVDRGGMGEVYEAFDSVVGARVALKTLLCSADEDAPGANRLGEEVKLAQRIAHPNVCRIHDLHEHRAAEHRSLRFLAMEYVDGVTLKERLLAEQLAIDEACSIAKQLLLGLGAVHAAGVLHLDFKSQNVMLRHRQAPAQAVVMDFSLSRAFEKELRLRTSERRAAGSIGYMSPEQLECQATLGPATDVYAFGVVFYEMLTGHMPFQGNSPAAIMLKQLKSRPTAPSRSRPAVSAALDEFVLTCMSRYARARFQSAGSALAALEQCLRPNSAERRRSGAAGLRTLGVAALAAVLAGTLVHLAWRLTAAAEASAAGQTVALEAVASQRPTPLEPLAVPLPPVPPPEPQRAAASALEQAPAPREAASASAPRSNSKATQAAVRGERSDASNPSDASVVAPTGRTTRSPAESVAAESGPAPRGPARPRPEAAPSAKEGWVPQSAPNFLL